MLEFVTLENIFWTIGLFATVLFLLKLVVFAIVGGDVELDVNFDSITEAETSFGFLSVQSILAFFMAFGWCGLAALNYLNVGTKVSIAIAVFTGLFFMWFSAYLMFNIKKLNKKIVVDINELVGKIGKAYTSFEPKSEGKIEITLNNKLSILDATNLSEEKINSFSEIKVEKIEDKKIYIVKV